MKTLVMVGLAILMAAIVPQMTVAAPVARQYTLVQVPVIELDQIEGPGGDYAEQYLAARIRSAVAKSGKAVVAVPGSQIAVTHRYLVTGEAGYYEEDGGRQLAGAVISSVVESAFSRASRLSGGLRGPAAYSVRDGYGGNNAINWRKKSAYVDLTLEAPNTATGLYGESGTVHARGTASLEDVGVNINARNFGGRNVPPAPFSDRNQGDAVGGEVKLFQKAADRALQQLIAGLSKPEKIGPITVKSGKQLVEGKTRIIFFRDKTQIVSYQILAVKGDEVSVWPIEGVSRPGQGDSFDIVQIR